jgi:peptidoglycan/LPS O-acetylase OafA/YrhL
VSRSLSLLVVGLWLGLLVSSWVMASANFREAERVARELPAPLAGALDAGSARAAFRFLASEINRWMFRAVALAQVALGALAVALLWRTGGAPRALAVAALAVVALQLGVLAPMIAEVGRQIDFLPRPLPPALGRRFGLLHGGYVLLDLAKMIGLAVAAFVLCRRS